MYEMTPHPLFDLLVDHVLVASENPFIATVALTDPQPVSVNRLYRNGKHAGEKVLTREGAAYKDGLSKAMTRASFEWKKAIDLVYQEGRGATLLVVLYFEQLRNKSWKPGARTETGNLQNPFLIRDASNYIKVIEDGVSEGIGINDCNNTNILIAKAEDPRRPRTELAYIVA